MWSRFLPSYGHVRDVIRAGDTGEPMCVQANFGHSMPMDTLVERLVRKELGGGSLRGVSH